MGCEYSIKNGCLTIAVPKELDHHCAERLRQEIDLLIGAYQVQKLVFDFSNTDFMDSSGIGVIIGRSRNMGFANGEVIAEHLNERIQKIFIVSGLHRLVQVR